MNNPSVSSAALKSLSRELGASVRFPGGEVFNSSGGKGIHTAVKPAPTVAPQEPKYMEQLLTQLVQMHGMGPHREPPAASVAAPTKAVWLFQFNRHPDGTIESIKATSEMPPQ